jgi:Zn-dependent protease with chaperone function
VPSYFWLEPATTSEEVGLACLAAAALALACCGAALWRAVRATSRSAGYIRYCQMVGRRACLGAEASPVWLVDGAAPFLALAGIVRPRLMVSSGVVSALAPEQLAAALRHEHAHEMSRDNLKRLLMLLAPDVVPFCRGFSGLERAWSRFTEWAADDRAVEGDSGRSLSLAAALVRVARMGACPQQPPLVTSLLAATDDLEVRVDRLLRGASDVGRGAAGLAWAAAGVCGVGLALALQPGTLYSVHRLLEHLTN